MRFLGFFLLLAVFPTLLVDSALAQGPILLFHAGRPVEDCMSLKGKEPPFDVRFSDGRVFAVKRFLGNGDMTCVLELSTGEALRVKRTNAGTVESSVKRFVEGHRKLDGHGLSIPGLKAYDTRHFEYAVVERIDEKFRLDEYFLVRHYSKSGNTGVVESLARSRESFGRIAEILADPARAQALDRAVDDLILSTFPFSKISDFRDEQIVWNGSKLVLLDWNEEIELAARPEDPTLTRRLNGVFGGPGEAWILTRDRRIFEVRRRHCGTLIGEAPGI